MKRIVFAGLLLIVFTGLAATLIDIPDALPPGVEIPAEAREILSPERIEQAVIYSDFRHGWYFFFNLLSFALLAALLALGISGWIRERAEAGAAWIGSLPNPPLVCGGAALLAGLLVVFLSATPEHPVSTGTLVLALAWGLVGIHAGRSERFARITLYVLILSILWSTIELPLSYYRGFVVEHYFELSVQSLGEWSAEYLKGNLIGYLLSVILVPLAYWGIRRRPRDWWLWIGAASVPLMIVLIVITPVYLDPLFNTYGPLEDEVLRERILTMAEEAGISGGHVFEVDMSEKTEKVNAYVTGLFGTKRIVLWDTILEKMTPDEIAFVMAHEMGHYVLNHVWKSIGLFTAVLLALLFLVSRTIGLCLRRWGDPMGVHEIDDIASLPLLLLMLSLLMFLIAPILNSYSRAHEHDADAFGLSITGDGATAATAFVKLANENLANPSPSPFIEFWLFTHPSLSDRIAFCRAYGKEPSEAP